jgi:hypothetical protein
VDNNYNQALYNMTCFFLICCNEDLPMQKQLLYDIYHSDLKEQVIEEIFLLSGLQFFNLLLFFNFKLEN